MEWYRVGSLRMPISLFQKIILPYESGLNPGPKDVLAMSGNTSNSTSDNNVTTLHSEA
jgi:hypothetical protein